ncbi:MAG: hypothetical protein ABSH51_29320 [Solirubrobacteraceae bacterium]
MPNLNDANPAPVPNSNDAQQPGFIDAMFDNRQAFQELVLGSEGNPGAFLEAFRRLVVQSSYSVDPKWDEVDVRRALAVVLNRTELYRHATPGIRVLTRAIKPVAVRNSSRKFVTRARASSGLRSALDELHEKDLISAGAERLPTELDKFYEAWEVSEDVWHEWNRAMESAHGEPADPSTGIDIASIDDFLIEDPWRKRRS